VSDPFARDDVDVAGIGELETESVVERAIQELLAGAVLEPRDEDIIARLEVEGRLGPGARQPCGEPPENRGKAEPRGDQADATGGLSVSPRRLERGEEVLR